MLLDWFRGVHHRARIRATRWFNPSYKSGAGAERQRSADDEFPVRDSPKLAHN